MEYKKLISRILNNNEDIKAQVWLFTYYQYNFIKTLGRVKKRKKLHIWTALKMIRFRILN